MKYRSTRGGVTNKSFEDALFSGFLSDGGIIMPEEVPVLSSTLIKSWSKLSYIGLMKAIVPYYVGDEISQDDINSLVDKAFASFVVSDAVVMNKLSENLNVFELFHGPTLAFKDLALSLVGQLLEYFLNKRKKHITVLVSTSGDTGSAAIQSVRGLKWVDILVMLPKNRVSRIQELQMTTVLDDNVHVYRVEGTADEADIIMKDIFGDLELVDKHNLCSINSINWARIMSQIAHYFYAYFKLCPEVDKEVEIVIPTGACGNVTAGLIAAEMGLPVKFVCAVNSNDIVARTISSGDFSNSSVVQSLAPAMDIMVPYNMERVLYIFTKGDTTLINKLLQEYERMHNVAIPKDVTAKIQQKVKSYVVDDEGIKSAMKACWQKNNYLLCPHTAVGVKYYYDHLKTESDQKKLRVCVATASPAKFEEAVEAAGLTPQPTEAVKKLDQMPTKFEDISLENGENALRNKLQEIYALKKDIT